MLFFEKCDEKQKYNGQARTGFSFTYSSQLNSSILYGGSRENDVYLFDHKRKTWMFKQTTSGKKQLSFRKYHAASILQLSECLLISGGQDENGRSLDDFHQLSLKDWKWTSLLIQKQSIPRQRHSLIPLSKTQTLLFGGISMPYKEYMNDCWIINKSQPSKYEVKQQWNCKRLDVKGTIPQGACFRQSTVLLGDKLYCGCQSTKNGQYAPIQVFCLELRSKAWRKLEYKFVAQQLKLYKTLISENEQGIILSVNESQKPQLPSFYLLPQNSTGLTQLEIGNNIISDIQPFISDSNWPVQIGCGGKGKRLFVARFWLEKNEILGNVEQYLIAIKNEQMLAQQLGKKNTLLQDLYKEMQNYISQLNRSYQRYYKDENVQMQKDRHIEDCQYLKEEYTRLNNLYEQSCKSIRELRGELSAIDEQFQRCIQTQFDEQA